MHGILIEFIMKAPQVINFEFKKICENIPMGKRLRFHSLSAAPLVNKNKQYGIGRHWMVHFGNQNGIY